MKNLKCLLFGHEFRLDIGVVDISGCTQSSCSIYMKCARCGELARAPTEQAHVLGVFAPSLTEKCTLVRSCKICGWTEKKVQHGEIILVKTKNPCKFNQICSVCEAVMGVTWKHGSTHAVNTNSPCIQNAVCDQCGKVVREIDRHDYGQPYMAGFYSESDCWTKEVTCRRCGYTKKA